MKNNSIHNFSNQNTLQLEEVWVNSNVGKLVLNTGCLFANPTLKWGKIHTIKVDAHIWIQEFISKFIPIFNLYIKRSLDAFKNNYIFSDSLILEFDWDKYARNIENIWKLLHDLLKWIVKFDKNNECMNKNIDDPDWEFEYLWERMFIIVFAPIYPITHSRTTNWINSVFISIQLESSFTYHFDKLWEKKVQKMIKSIR